MKIFIYKNIGIFLLMLFTLFHAHLSAQQNSAMDATLIASNYYNSIVKILLIDSIAEKQKPGSGYLGRGSGFIVTEEGVIFTNRHVIDFCSGIVKYSYYNIADRKIYSSTSQYDSSALSNQSILSINYIGRATPIVQVYNSKNGDDYKLYYAKLVAVDTANFDGAILKIVSDLNGNPVSEKFHPIPIGNSDSTNQGEDLCVYGFPAQYDAGFDIMLQDQSTLTFGKHSGFDYVFNPYYGYIKADASINTGNSGGPVFNSSNKVIGIATATSTKTNMGLVGGINAMYDLASLQPELLKQLSGKGLAQPSKTPTVKSTMLARKVTMPTEKNVKQSNIYKKNVRKLKGGMWYLQGFYPMIQNDKFTIEDDDINPGIEITTDNPLNVQMKSGFGVEIGHLFTLWRISDNNKLSLGFANNVITGTRDFTRSNIYKDTANSLIAYKSNAQFYRFGMRLGLTFSYLLFKQFILDSYYKFSFVGEDGNEIAKVSNNYMGYSDEVRYAPTDLFLMHSFGFNIRHNFYFIGMEYTFKGNVNSKYQLPYVESTFDGANYWYNYKTAQVAGRQKIGTLYLTAGLTWGGRTKWKRLVRKGKWKMDSK